MNEEEYKKCLAILINNLEGNCCDFRPISYEFALKLAQFGKYVLGGMTCEEAAQHQQKQERE